MFTYRKFDVNVVRELEFSQLAWPGRREAIHDSSLGCNLEYADLRGLGWAEAKRVIALESELIGRIDQSTDVDAECESIEDYLYQRAENLYGLDLGVASTVICLSAAKCIPVTSCNGGAFGGSHQEAYPLVAFFARSRTAEQILVAAKEANIGLENGAGGSLLAYAADIRDIRAFANCILKRRRLLRAVRDD